MESVDKQTVKPFEVVVVDDCSTDHTVDIVNQFISTHDLNVKLYHAPKNMGIGVSRQKGAELAQSEYIAYLSADDCYHPKFIECSLLYLKPNAATYTPYYRCDENLCTQTVFIPPRYSKDSVAAWALKKNMYVNFSSIIVPKCIFSEVAFEGSLRHGEDLIFLLDTIVAKLDWCLVEEPLVYYRIHSLAGTFTQRPEEFELLWRYLGLRLQKLGVSALEIQRAYSASRAKAFPLYPRRIASKIYKLTKRLLS